MACRRVSIRANPTFRTKENDCYSYGTKQWLVCRSDSIDPRGNPVANPMRRVCALLLLPDVRMAVPALLKKGGPQYVAQYGTEKSAAFSTECILVPCTSAVRVSESAKKSPRNFRCNSTIRPRQGRSFLAPPSRTTHGCCRATPNHKAPPNKRRTRATRVIYP